MVDLFSFDVRYYDYVGEILASHVPEAHFFLSLSDAPRV